MSKVCVWDGTALRWPGVTVDPGPPDDDDALYPRLSRGYGWTSAEASARTGIARWGLTVDDLTLYTGPADIPAGSRLDKMLFTSHISLNAGDIEITRSVIRPATYVGSWPSVRGTNDSGDGPAARVRVIDCEITGAALVDGVQRALTTGVDGMVDVIGCEIHLLGSGVAIRSCGPEATRTWPVEVSSNYVHTLVSYGDPATTGNHVDSFTIRDYGPGVNRGVMVENNWFDCLTPNSSGALFLQAWPPGIHNVTVTGNLFAGGAQPIALMGVYGASNVNVSITGNRVIHGQQYVGYYQAGNQPEWSDNWLYSAGNAPTYAGQQAFIGIYG